MSVSKVVETALQQATVDLNALALQGKQAHWNIVGTGFRSLHLLLDELVDFSRTSYDEFAERLVAIGGNPDARANTIANTASLSPIDPGPIGVDKAYAHMEEAVLRVAEVMKSHIDAVDAEDHLSADLLISTARELEKTAWMLRAERPVV
ncbi:MAG: DNA starvation/stationary phase protection protein [Actinomycetaceae bacterium]|nr:DNA starvation/stationary phase protection protein [Actinomycetaceae bacterium]